jgi:hypothetical protein
MPSGVATAGEPGVEAALIGVLRRSGDAVLAVAGPFVPAVLVPAVLVPGASATVVRAIVRVREAVVPRVPAVSAVVAAELGIRSVLVLGVEPGCEAATATERVSVATAEATSGMAGAEPVLGREAATEAATEAAGSEAVTTTASTGERSLFVPAERTGDLLERAHRGLEGFGAHGVRDLGADAVDDAAEALLGRTAVVGQCPAVAVGDDPATLDDGMQLVGVQGATGGRGAIDDVEEIRQSRRLACSPSKAEANSAAIRRSTAFSQ